MIDVDIEALITSMKNVILEESLWDGIEEVARNWKPTYDDTAILVKGLSYYGVFDAETYECLDFGGTTITQDIKMEEDPCQMM